ALLLVPIYLRTFGTHLYGAWLASGEVLNFLQLFDLGLTNVVTQRIGQAHARNEPERVAEVFGSAVLAMTTIGALLALVALGFSFFVAGVMTITGSEGRTLAGCFRLGALATFLFVANFSVLGLSRGLQDTAIQNGGVVLGAVAGFATTAVFLWRGAGLWSIPAGMCARTAVALSASILFVFRLRRTGQLPRIRASRDALKEFARLSPATTLSGIGYLLTTQTEGTLVAVLLGPERVPVLFLTRRAIDVASGILNTIAYSSYAGFSHLVASPDRGRARAVHDEVLALWTALAVTALATFYLVNQSLVTVWTGAATFGGPLLTLLVGAQVFVAGRLQVTYYLFRATGEIVSGSMLQSAESLTRLATMALLIWWAGLPGPALATLLIGLPMMLYVERRTRAMLRPFAEEPPRVSLLAPLTQFAIVAAAAVGGYVLYQPHWPVVIAAGGTAALVAVLIQLRVDPHLAKFSMSIWERMPWLRPARAGGDR
ncbi:MAG: lipopolysaccharide biosynthesis protein, partial [Gemmatimonadaceae bacterium]